MPASRVPVEIVRVKGGNGNLQMVPQVPLGELMRHPDRDVQKEMDGLAARYSAVIAKAKEILSVIEVCRRENKRVAASLYWDLGDLLQSFIESNERSPIFLNGIKGHFTRDLGISSASWKKILRLRHLIPSRDLVDDSRSWKFYRDAPSEEILDSIAGYRDQTSRRRGKVEPALTQRTLPLFEREALPQTASLTKPQVSGKTATRGRNRIEVHLPPEVIGGLSRLAEELGLSRSRPAAAARALLIAILNQIPRNTQVKELLASARRLAEARQGNHRRSKRN